MLALALVILTHYLSMGDHRLLTAGLDFKFLLSREFETYQFNLSLVSWSNIAGKNLLASLGVMKSSLEGI